MGDLFIRICLHVIRPSGIVLVGWLCCFLLGPVYQNHVMWLYPVTDNARAAGPSAGVFDCFFSVRLLFFFTSCLISISWGASLRPCT